MATDVAAAEAAKAQRKTQKKAKRGGVSADAGESMPLIDSLISQMVMDGQSTRLPAVRSVNRIGFALFTADSSSIVLLIKGIVLHRC